MADPILILALFLVIFGSTFVRAALGFGNALIAMPLLILLVGSRTASPLVAVLGLVIAVLMLMGSWQQVDFPAAWGLILSTLVGIPLGLFFLSTAPEQIIRVVLGIGLISFGLYNLLGPTLPRISHPAWTALFGFLGGILGGAYNSNGPPIVIYGVMRGWQPDRFRATLQGYFLVTGVAVAAGHAAAGLWTREVLRLFTLSLPAVFLAVYLGRWTASRIAEERFQPLLHFFLIIAGGLMFIG